MVRQKGASEGFFCWIGEIWNFISVGSITLPFPNITHQGNPATIQQLPSEQSTEDGNPDTKVEG